MIKFEIKTKKSKVNIYEYYKYPKNIMTGYISYLYKKFDTYLLFTAILQYISDRYNVPKIEVSIYKDGKINVYYYMANKNFTITTYYYINDFYLDSDKNILYKIENDSDRLSIYRKLKLQEINNK